MIKRMTKITPSVKNTKDALKIINDSIRYNHAIQNFDLMKIDDDISKAYIILDIVLESNFGNTLKINKVKHEDEYVYFIMKR